MSVRHVHLGLGNFFRAHQAWYTDRSPDRDGWGIAAFTGRSHALADTLTAQDGRYTLITRGPDGDRADVITALRAAHAGSDQAALTGYLVDPAVAVVTLTVTEAGYHRFGDDLDASAPDVAADVAAMRADPASAGRTVLGRLVRGLHARRIADAGPLSVVSCDNLPANGRTTARVLTTFASLVDPALADWIGSEVAFVDTVVDRITPRLPDADLQAAVAGLDHVDRAPVVTEPFSEWILAGAFRAGRPAWDDAGAVFTDDVTAYEHRKLWLLNGGHSLLAYAGSARGHRTVADAVADPVCRAWLEQWWDEACRALPQPAPVLARYRAELVQRFGNRRIAHALAQIATDGSQKLPIRVATVLNAERAAGRMPPGAITVVAAWVAHLRGAGAPVADVRAVELQQAAAGPLPAAVRRVLAHVSAPLADDDDLADAVTEAAAAAGV